MTLAGVNVEKVVVKAAMAGRWGNGPQGVQNLQRG